MAKHRPIAYISLLLMIATNGFSQKDKRRFELHLGPGVQTGFSNNNKLVTNDEAMMRFDLVNNIHYNKRKVALSIEAGLAYSEKYFIHLGYIFPEKGTEILDPTINYTSISFNTQKWYADFGMRFAHWGERNGLVAALNWLYIDNNSRVFYNRVMPPIIDRWETDYRAKAHNFGLKLMYRKRFYHTQFDFYAVMPIFVVASVDYHYQARYETNPGNRTNFTEQKDGHQVSSILDPKKRNLLELGIRFSFLLGIK